jgi:hypothetical protein
VALRHGPKMLNAAKELYIEKTSWVSANDSSAFEALERLG